MMMYTFVFLHQKYPFLANLLQKIKIVCLKLKFSTQANSSKVNAMVIFTFSILDQECPSWVNVIQEIKIVY